MKKTGTRSLNTFTINELKCEPLYEWQIYELASGEKRKRLRI